MHVGQTRAIDRRTEDEKLFLGEPFCGPGFGARKPLTGFRPRTAGSKSGAFHARVAAGNFGTKSGDVVCATPAGANNVAANMAVPNTNR
jgi:hypothetical protein